MSVHKGMHDILDWQSITSQEQVITISRDSNSIKLHEKDLTITNVLFHHETKISLPNY